MVRFAEGMPDALAGQEMVLKILTIQERTIKGL
jgi:hypothetical protein